VKITGRRVSVHDIAPTVLHLLGLPVALDMEGGVIGEAFADGFLNANPVRTVPSYGFLRGESREDFFGGEEDEDLYRERLEALGYVSE
jgi:arylsulfatase A-like enzyme